MYAYKESEIIKELSGEEIVYLKTSNININTDIVELNKQLESHLSNEVVDDESRRIVESIINELKNINLKKYCRVIFVEPDFSDGTIISAISNIEDFRIGDEVVVKTKYEDVDGIVREVAYYKEENLPYPLDVMYEVTEIVYRSDEKIED